MDDRYAHYRLIVDASDDAIITKNLEGVISSWNTGAPRMFGYTASEAVGQPIARRSREALQRRLQLLWFGFHLPGP